MAKHYGVYNPRRSKMYDNNAQRTGYQVDEGEHWEVLGPRETDQSEQ